MFRTSEDCKTYLNNVEKNPSGSGTYDRLFLAPVTDPGEEPGGATTLFLNQTEVRRAEKNFLGDRPPRPFI